MRKARKRRRVREHFAAALRLKNRHVARVDTIRVRPADLCAFYRYGSNDCSNSNWMIIRQPVDDGHIADGLAVRRAGDVMRHRHYPERACRRDKHSKHHHLLSPLFQIPDSLARSFAPYTFLSAIRQRALHWMPELGAGSS